MVTIKRAGTAKTATIKYKKLKQKNQTLAVTKGIKFTKKGNRSD